MVVFGHDHGLKPFEGPGVTPSPWWSMWFSIKISWSWSFPSRNPHFIMDFQGFPSPVEVPEKFLAGHRNNTRLWLVWMRNGAVWRASAREPKVTRCVRRAEVTWYGTFMWTWYMMVYKWWWYMTMVYMMVYNDNDIWYMIYDMIWYGTFMRKCYGEHDGFLWRARFFFWNGENVVYNNTSFMGI